MRELQHITWFAEPDQEKDCSRILRKHGITEAKQTARSWGKLDYKLKLLSDDPRWPPLVVDLKKLGLDVIDYFKRTFTEAEREASPWLHMIINTYGVVGGTALDQPSDRSVACPTCGAGSELLPPLIADLRRTGEKRVFTAGRESLVVAWDVAQAIQDAGLTGIQFLPVHNRNAIRPHALFCWMKVLPEWPLMSSRSIVQVFKPCRECGRAGHTSFGHLWEFHYDAFPAKAADFNRTWEYFGEWDLGGQGCGGIQEIIVSQRAYRVLRSEKLSQLLFEPIVLDSSQTKALTRTTDKTRSKSPRKR